MAKHTPHTPAASARRTPPRGLRLLAPAAVVVALLAIAYCLLTYERDFLWKAQELNLFLDTPLFLHQQTVTSGWLLTWLGTFFTDFFYHPALGVALLGGWWALLVVLLGRTFRVPLQWWTVLLVPVALLLLTDVDLGYWVYYLKLRGHFFAATIGTSVAVASVWLFRLVPQRWGLRAVYAAASTALLYPLVGFYGLLSSVLMAVLSWRLPDMSRRSRVVVSVVALLCVVAVPLVCYRYVFCQTNLVNIYWTGLPLYVIAEEHTAYYTPFYLLVAFLLVVALLYRPDRPSMVRRPWRWAVAQVALLAVLVAGVQRYWYKDYNFHKELRMAHLVEQLDWEGVLAEAATLDDEPTRAIVMMKNLALFRLGRQGDEMYHYRTGAKASATPIPLRMTQVVGRTLYYHYGQLNFCYRWCLEDGVEMGWRVEYLKYLVRCSLVNGEWRVARKYIDLLKHTRYHREWAERHERLLYNRAAIEADAEMGPIVHMTDYVDRLSSDNSLVEYYLMHQYTDTPSDDPLFQEQTLLAVLWKKDIQAFWPCFFHYAQLHQGEHMPIHYQEAAYLYGHLENQVDISHMPFDASVVSTYQEFMALAQRCAGMSEEQMRDVFYPRFGQTFYYEYFLVRNQKLY